MTILSSKQNSLRSKNLLNSFPACQSLDPPLIFLLTALQLCLYYPHTNNQQTLYRNTQSSKHHLRFLQLPHHFLDTRSYGNSITLVPITCCLMKNKLSSLMDTNALVVHIVVCDIQFVTQNPLHEILFHFADPLLTVL